MAGRVSRRRLVAFLGISAYEPVVYRMGPVQAEPTPYIQCALLELLDVHEVIVLGTEEAQQAQWEVLLPELLKRLPRGAPAPRFVRVPSPLDGELWNHFDPILEAVSVDEETEIVFDTTHGFRLQPIFAVAALTFIRSIPASTSKSVEGGGGSGVRFQPLHRLVYGEKSGRIVELSSVLELLDWARALAVFLETGHHGEVSRLSEDTARAWAKEAAGENRRTEVPRNLRRLAGAIKNFAMDLATVRTQQMLLGGERESSSADALVRAITETRDDIEQHIPPMARVLDPILERTRRLNAENLGSQAGRQALAALARFYMDLHRYPEVAATVREYWVTWYATAVAPQAVNPGERGCTYQARESASKAWQVGREKQMKLISAIRNDIEHAGYKAQPYSASVLVKKLEELVSEVEEHARECEGPPRPAIGGKGPPPALKDRPGVLVNISNHPLDAWSDEQKDAARALAPELAEIPFPQVAPQTGIEKVEEMVKDVVSCLPKGTTHAMVQGEFTMTVALVRDLQARGIICVAATRERSGQGGEGESGVSTPFRFVGFRSYPVLVRG